MSKVMRRGLHLLIISAITAIFCMLTVVGVSANVGDTFTVNTIEGAPITYKVTSDAFQTVEVCDCQQDYNENSGIVTLPESVENPNNNMEYSVTNISNQAFQYCRSLTWLTIPNTVITIGDFAFDGCENLNIVNLPNQLKSIGKYSFRGCEGLDYISIPNSVISIGEFAFSECESLTEISVPDSVTTIENGVFHCCKNLTNVSIPNSIKSIGTQSFAFCENLKEVSIPSSVQSIGTSAFANCEKLTNVTVCSIDPPAIGENVFVNCFKLKNIHIPYGTKDAYIEHNFDEKKLWYSWELKESFSMICGTVTDEYGTAVNEAKVTISYNIDNETITRTTYTNFYGKYEFVEQPLIKEYIITIEKDGFISINDNKNEAQCNLVLLKSDMFTKNTIEGTAITYQITSKNFDSKTGTVKVAYGPGRNHSESITVPETVEHNGFTYTVTEIGEKAFEWYEFLEGITLPTTVTTIGEHAFECCSRLNSIVMPGVKNIGYAAFNQCKKLKNITLPACIKNIDDFAFYKCSSLDTVKIESETPPTLGFNVFGGCSPNLEIKVPEVAVNVYKSSESWSDYKVNPIA